MTLATQVWREIRTGRTNIKEYAIGKKVEHPEFGPGTVMVSSTDALEVLFDGVGYRTLDAKVVEDRDLLKVPVLSAAEG